MEATQGQVIKELIDAGWRYEQLDSASLPVLTNAPHGKNICVACGDWGNESDVRKYGVCRMCWWMTRRIGR